MGCPPGRVCGFQVCDLALLTVRDDAFWAAELRGLEFVDVPELQARRPSWNRAAPLDRSACVSHLFLLHPEPRTPRARARSASGNVH